MPPLTEVVGGGIAVCTLVGFAHDVGGVGFGAHSGFDGSFDTVRHGRDFTMVGARRSVRDRTLQSPTGVAFFTLPISCAAAYGRMSVG